MPAMDGTGPEGLGARTGRGLGSCNTLEDNITNRVTNNISSPAIVKAVRRLGLGRFNRYRRGRCGW